eukprot:scaffold672560_cov37-Prasinocladus_malaysianus.AAC.1
MDPPADGGGGPVEEALGPECCRASMRPGLTGENLGVVTLVLRARSGKNSKNVWVTIQVCKTAGSQSRAHCC